MTDLVSSSIPPLQALFHADAISLDTRGVNARLARTLSMLTPLGDLTAMRDAYEVGRMGLPATPKAPHARTVHIPGPGGEIALRVLVPDIVRGAYFHIHGGGWMLGTNDMQDALLEMIGVNAELVGVSVEYRLAPEYPFPAPVDDCVAAARWLIEHAKSEFGAGWLAIGGESAGTHLAVSTLLRLHDADLGTAFSAANLTFGCFDLSLTPSMRSAQNTAFIDRATLEQMATSYAGARDLRDPLISPLYADLGGLPSALFSVGTLDPLVDDSLFMHRPWQAAGNAAELAIYPGGVHGCHLLGGEIADAANARIGRFLRQSRADGAT